MIFSKNNLLKFFNSGGLIPNTVLAIIICLTLWIGGFFYYIYSTNSYELKPTRTDAIVVFAGKENRIATAVQLLKASYAPILFVTGVESRSQLNNYLRENQINSAQVIYGIGGQNVSDAAKKAGEFIVSNNIKSLRLVTSSYNMPIALARLKANIPDGTRVILHPIFLNSVSYFTVFKEYNRYLLEML